MRPDTDVTHALQVIVPAILDHYLREDSPLDQSTRDTLVKNSLGGKVRKIEWHTK